MSQGKEALARLLFLLLSTYLHPKQEEDRDSLTVQVNTML